VIEEGSPVIGSNPYFGVYNRTGTVDGYGSAFFDDSILTYATASESNPAPVRDLAGALVSSGAGMALSWTAESGVSYIVSATTNLVAGPLINVSTNVAGADGTLSVTNDIADDQQFFRIDLGE
jgi:hypothetical protein